MSLARQKMGWIGIDIGTSTVKIAQVALYKERWKLQAAAVVPRQQGWSTNLSKAAQAFSSLDELTVARSLQKAYRGRKVAANLPMALCDVHSFDRALDQEPNASQLVRQTIETATQQSVEHLQCDYWSAHATENKPGWTQVLTVPREWTEQLCVDISQAGWSCETIDGLPMTMARAVGMVHSDTPTAPLAALDWGYGRATLCFLENGQPSYVRCLKDCGLRYVQNSLVENLQVTELEAQQLLEKYGLTATSAERSSEMALLVKEIIAGQMNQLVEEIKRSFSHFQYLRRTSRPQCLYLFGGGAMISQVEERLAERLEIETRRWQLPSTGTDRESMEIDNDCLLAPAIALSALAWEA